MGGGGGEDININLTNITDEMLTNSSCFNRKANVSLQKKGWQLSVNSKVTSRLAHQKKEPYLYEFGPVVSEKNCLSILMDLDLRSLAIVYVSIG